MNDGVDAGGIHVHGIGGVAGLKSEVSQNIRVLVDNLGAGQNIARESSDFAESGDGRVFQIERAAGSIGGIVHGNGEQSRILERQVLRDVLQQAAAADIEEIERAELRNAAGGMPRDRSRDDRCRHVYDVVSRSRVYDETARLRCREKDILGSDALDHSEIGRKERPDGHGLAD